MKMESQLEAWMAAETGQRARNALGVGPGVLPREAVASMDGLAQMLALMNGELPHAHIARMRRGQYLQVLLEPGDPSFVEVEWDKL